MTTPSADPTPLDPQAAVPDRARSDDYVTFGANGRIVAIGRYAATVLGAEAHALIGTDLLARFDRRIVHTIGAAGNARRLVRGSRERGTYRLTNVRLARDGALDRRVDLVVRHHPEENGALTTLHLRDAGEAGGSREIVERLSRFSTLAAFAPAGIIQLGPDLSCLYANDTWQRLSGLDAQASAGHGWLEAIHPDDVDETLEQMRPALARKRTFRHKVRLRATHGETLWVRLDMKAELDGTGAIAGILLLVSDVTENHRLVERLHDLAHKDALTGLWNRTAWIDTLDRRMDAADRVGRLGVLYIDLDGFKAINDTVGHDHGDALLKAVGERLASAVRPEDMLARLGGDEFAVVMPDLPDEEAAAAVARRIVRTVGQPFTILGKELSVGASVGVALADDGEIDRETLVKRADTALYAAKHAGRSRHVFYTADQDRAQRERSALSVAVRRAVDATAFALRYQPRIDVETDRLVGVEALLRLDADGAIPGLDTQTLVDILESTGLIGDVGRWVLDGACAQLARWRAAGSVDDDFAMSVNVSPRQLGQPGFVDEVARTLERHALPPKSLVLEITESALVESRDDDVVHRLKALGVSIALDDFGKGYSSLAYLGKLPLDHLKIDRSFVDDLVASEEARKIVRCIVSLASSLGMRVTAEGVENVDTLRLLEAEGCHDWQGYLYSRPVEAGRIEELFVLEDHRRTPDARTDGAPAENPDTGRRFSRRPSPTQ